MSVQPAIFELMNAPGFSLESGESIFRFLVVLGYEQDRGVRERVKGWFEFGISSMPHTRTLIPLFTTYLMNEFPFARATDIAFRNESVKRLQRAQLGASAWEPRVFVRLHQLLSVLMAYEHMLTCIGSSQTQGEQA